MLHSEQYDSILGTPSAQKILRLLYCWEQLPVKELMNKTELSESQIYNTLRALELINLVESVSRGLYTYTKSNFSLKLHEAYISQLVQIIGQELHEMGSILDSEAYETLDEKYTKLITLWEPLLDKYYPLKISSIAGHILERYQ